MELQHVAMIAGALVLATWAHYRFWSWRLRVRPEEDELVRAETADGWSLALARRRPRGTPRPVPVLLVHGIAANHLCLDFPRDGLSLPAFLADAGFDCFSLDLRGHGRSRPLRPDAARSWDVDTYATVDLPAALDAIRRETGSEQVLYVGHSQGALIGLIGCQTVGDRIAGIVAMAGPVHFRAGSAASHLVRFGFAATGKLNRFLARSLAPFSGWFHPPVSQVVINTHNVARPVYRRVLVNVVENINAGVLKQFGAWIKDDAFRSRDGAIDYRAGLARCRQPALFVGAALDQLAPPDVVAAAYEPWGGEKELFVAGLDAGCACDYGHTDILLGRTAPQDVFPRVRDWLRKHSGEAAAAM
ncbi:MAG TPA: alpha/beta hydrolase [Anaeromyxobacteraceae bacterium]|nr:alpha/beta hydrolase [Anaeromyxobacteraceae bacterium]